MSLSPHVTFIMSTGRCSTQFLAKLLALGTPQAEVVHEGAGPNYKPAQVFRGGGFDTVIESTQKLRAEFKRIDAVLAQNKSFIDTGWPAYAWGPYFAHRYGDAFQFAHLVRNPFAVAASMSTHRLLGDHEDDLSQYGIIRPRHPHAVFKEFAPQYPAFTRFERGLLHWLEVNTYLLEQHEKAGFLGLYRFEEMYGGDTPSAKALWAACGFAPEGYQELPAYDKYNCRTGRFLPPNKALLNRVWGLALQLGYAAPLLEKWSDVEFLSEHYRQLRVAPPPRQIKP